MLVSLGEHCDFLGGFAFKSQDLKESDGIPVIKIKNVNGRVVSLNDVQFFSVEKMSKKLERFLLADGDVLIAMTGQGSVGRVGRFRNINNRKVLLNQRVGKFLPKESLDLGYLYYILSSEKFEKTLFNAASGSGQPNLSPDIIKSIKIPYLPKNEQIYVAEVLGKLDEKVELNKQTNNTLEQMAQALFKSWFIDFDPVVDNALAASNPIPDELAHRVEVRKKAHALPDFQPLPEHTRSLFPSEFEQTGEPTVGIGGWVPKGWDIKPVNKVGEIVCGKTPSKNNPDFYGEDVPFIKIPDMHGNMLITETSDSLSYEGDSSQPKKRIPKNSICVSCIATVGLVSITTEPSHTNQQINSIVPIDTAQVEYLYFQMKSLNKKFHDLASGGSATLNMNTRTFGSIDILVPNQVVINEFHNRVSSLVSKIELCKRESKQLASIRDSLLPKLISGEIQLQPASNNMQEAELQGA